MELVLDLHNCDPSTFTRESLDNYFTQLCDLIEMRRFQVHFWDDLDLPVHERDTRPQTTGTSAVCFILTSTIVVHTLDLLSAVYINIFSCKPFDASMSEQFSREWFKGETVGSTSIDRR